MRVRSLGAAVWVMVVHSKARRQNVGRLWL
jgi:hypothetical protein